jgi:hypothetical protein
MYSNTIKHLPSRDLSRSRATDSVKLDVHAVPAGNMLRSVYRPFLGTLDEDAKARLRRFMGKVREAAGAARDLATGSDFHLGGFKVVLHDGELGLSKLETPPYEAFVLHPLIAEALPKTIEVFKAHFEDVQVAVWQAMSKCGYVEYLKAHARSLINDDWEILVDIDPYFSRNPTQIAAHKDTQGENMFLMLLYCNDQPIEGFEYILRPEIPHEHLTFMRQQLPSVFVDEVEDVLKEPPDHTAYAPTIEPWGFVAACDELMVHSTPFVHHRGAFEVQSVITSMGTALRRCFGVSDLAAYRALQEGGSQATPSAVAQSVHELVTQLRELPPSDPWIDPAELKKVFETKLSEFEATMFIEALKDVAVTKDPFDGAARVNILHLNYTAVMTVPRDKELRRAMSEKLDEGTALPHRGEGGRDFLRVWIMARRKEK